jgi:hypothetical protein
MFTDTKGFQWDGVVFKSVIANLEKKRRADLKWLFALMVIEPIIL